MNKQSLPQPAICINPVAFQKAEKENKNPAHYADAGMGTFPAEAYGHPSAEPEPISILKIKDWIKEKNSSKIIYTKNDPSLSIYKEDHSVWTALSESKKQAKI